MHKAEHAELLRFLLSLITLKLTFRELQTLDSTGVMRWNVANTLQTHGFSLLLTTPHDFILAAFTISPTPAKVTVG